MNHYMILLQESILNKDEQGVTSVLENDTLPREYKEAFSENAYLYMLRHDKKEELEWFLSRFQKNRLLKQALRTMATSICIELYRRKYKQGVHYERKNKHILIKNTNSKDDIRRIISSKFSCNFGEDVQRIPQPLFLSKKILKLSTDDFFDNLKKLMIRIFTIEVSKGNSDDVKRIFWLLVSGIEQKTLGIKIREWLIKSANCFSFLKKQFSKFYNKIVYSDFSDVALILIKSIFPCFVVGRDTVKKKHLNSIKKIWCFPKKVNEDIATM